MFNKNTIVYKDSKPLLHCYALKVPVIKVSIEIQARFLNHIKWTRNLARTSRSKQLDRGGSKSPSYSTNSPSSTRTQIRQQLLFFEYIGVDAPDKLYKFVKEYCNRNVNTIVLTYLKNALWTVTVTHAFQQLNSSSVESFGLIAVQHQQLCTVQHQHFSI